jgi:hypothetical protein
MALPARFVGRFRVRDGRITDKTGDYEPPAQKTEVSRFKGEHHISERDAETGDLIIFRIDNSAGVPGVETFTADRAPKNLTDLQRMYDEAYGSRRQTFEQRATRHGAGEALADRVRRR